MRVADTTIRGTTGWRVGALAEWTGTTRRAQPAVMLQSRVFSCTLHWLTVDWSKLPCSDRAAGEHPGNYG